MIKVEFSGHGHYGICTIVNKKELPAIADVLTKQKTKETWHNPGFESEYCTNYSIGFNQSLRSFDLPNDDSEEIRFGWNPRSIETSMETHGHLTRTQELISGFKKENPDGMWLESFVGVANSGWLVGANFSSEVWDVIESSVFREQLPAINEDIQKWWEDQSWTRQRSQYTTVFNGRDGPTVQVYQPAGNGLWIAGSRNSSDPYQITDHNTDTGFLALGHIVSLCTILKHCKQIAGK